MIELNNLFYFSNINSIGGVESFFYYLVKKYQDIDITIVYDTADIKQLKRLQKYVKTIQNKGQKIKCKKAFFNYNSMSIIDNVEADEYIQIIHCDYKALKLRPRLHSKITKYVGVSEQVCKSFKEITGIDCELIYNPIEIDKPKKVLHLISATRLTPEKGKSRIEKLGRMLDSARIPYVWTIFTNDTNAIDNPNIIYMKPKLNIIDYIADADILVQLSDSEAYCYSVIEALLVGIPVLVTDLPVYKELGIESDTHGYVVDFDLNNLDIDKLYNNVLKFNYKAKEDIWKKYLYPSKSTYVKQNKVLNTVTAIENFTYDKYNKLENIVRKNPKENKEGTLYIGDMFDCDDEIMDYLLRRNRANKPLIEIIYNSSEG